MNKKVTLSREGKTEVIAVRQMAHDAQAIVGKKFKWGGGKMWTVVNVAEVN